jgi:hypothetical protein
VLIVEWEFGKGLMLKGKVEWTGMEQQMEKMKVVLNIVMKKHVQ